MKLLLALIAGLALSTAAYAQCGGGSCDGKKGDKDKEGGETASSSIVIE